MNSKRSGGLSRVSRSWVSALIVVSSLASITAVIEIGAPAAARADATYDAAAQFSSTSNPIGTWSYGWASSRGASFNLDTHRTNVGGADIWFEPRGDPVVPGVFHNGTDHTVNPFGAQPLAPGELAFHPGPAGDNAVVRWTAPAVGEYTVTATFTGADVAGTTTDVAVMRGPSQLLAGVVNGYGTSRTYAGTVAASTGDTLDFTVGYGTNQNYTSDMTRLDVAIEPAPNVVWQGRSWFVNSAGNVEINQSDDAVAMTFDPAKIGLSSDPAGQYAADCTFSGDFGIRVDYSLPTYPIPNGIRVGLVAAGAVNGTASTMERRDGGYFQNTPGWPYHNGHDTTATSGTIQLSRESGSWNTYLADSSTGGQLVPFDSTPAYGDATIVPIFSAWTSSLYYTGVFAKVVFSNFQVVNRTCVPNHADTTPPTITGSAAPAPNANGWNNSVVTVTFVCSDAESGIASCPDPAVLSSEGANQTASGTATDNAGNTASGMVGPINIDMTSPDVTGAATTPPNDAGWYRGDVTIHWSCSDALSGLDGACPGDSTITGEGANLSAAASATDRAGNVGTGTVRGVHIDRTPPVTALDAPDGWSNSSVDLTFTASDSLSGVASTHYSLDGGNDQTGSALTVHGEGNHTLTFYSVDVAGNREDAHTVSIKIDLTAPTITHVQDPGANANGWSNTSVTVTFTCSDDLSGIASCTGPQTVSTEGAVQAVRGTAVDNAGNRATDPATVSIDTTPPQIQAAVSAPANANGWRSVPTTVSFTCSDALSGIASCTHSVTFGQGQHQHATGTAVDAADNRSTITVDGIDVDTTPPTITGVIVTPAGPGGWYSTDVEVDWTCSDDLSGIDGSCPSPTIVTGSGAGLSASASVSDRAGNSSTATVGGINIDRSVRGLSSGTTTCNGTYTGNGKDVVVRAGAICRLLPGTTVSHDVIVQTGGALFAQGVTVGHDLSMSQSAPSIVCATSIGHDVYVSGLPTGSVATVIGDVASGCAAGDSVGHDLVVQSNAAPVVVGDTVVGHDLSVLGNHPGGVTVERNQAGHDAICGDDTPLAGSRNSGIHANSCPN